jgi:hypothetical protein
MTLHKHNPVPEESMDAVNPEYSICEVLRGIYHKTDDEDIKYQCRVAVAMAKAMSKRIVQLSGKQHWFDGFWDKKD